MAQRTLDSSFWDDEDVAKLSIGERLLLICMVTDVSLSDDYGNLPASARVLKKHAFGYDDDITTEAVLQWRNGILAKCRNVLLYTVGGQEYISLTKFHQRQHLKFHRKTSIPPPPDQPEPAEEPEEEPSEVVEPEETPEDGAISENCGNTAEVCEIISPNCDNPANNFGTFRLSSVEKSSEEKDSVGLGSVVEADAGAKPQFSYPYLLDMYKRLSEKKKIRATDGEGLEWLFNEYGGVKLEGAIRESAYHGAVNLPYIKAILEERGSKPAPMNKSQGGEVMMPWGN